MWKLRKTRRKRTMLSPIADKPMLSAMAGIAAISAIGFGMWWNRKRQ